jgi:acetyl-CoA acetyltransferase family protein
MKLEPPIALVGVKRTHIGKLGGGLAGVTPHLLLAECFKATLAPLEATGVRLAGVDDVVVGNVRNSIGNIARVAALEAGLPESVPAVTVDRQCASGMEALAVGACRVAAGFAEVVLAGGVESASRAPWLFEKTRRPYAYLEPRPHEVQMASRASGNLPMGETAERLADEFGLERAALDAFALKSHQKAARAVAEGAFDAETSADSLLARDECVRPDTTLESLAALRPVFRKTGVLTAGNSSPLNDGAAACLVMRADTAKRLGLTPDAVLTGIDTVGLDPNRMGLGPALSIPRLMADLGLDTDTVDLFEINEAFSAQMLATLGHLEASVGIVIPEEKLNVNGGAIALGHPLGATGLRLIATLVNALRRRGLKTGMASLCVGGGQGMSAAVEVPR